MAEIPLEPVRRRIASNSEVFRFSAPTATSRSRGRSWTGMSFMRMHACGSRLMGARRFDEGNFIVSSLFQAQRPRSQEITDHRHENSAENIHHQTAPGHL